MDQKNKCKKSVAIWNPHGEHHIRILGGDVMYFGQETTEETVQFYRLPEYIACSFNHSFTTNTPHPIPYYFFSHLCAVINCGGLITVTSCRRSRSKAVNPKFWSCLWRFITVTRFSPSNLDKIGLRLIHSNCANEVQNALYHICLRHQALLHYRTDLFKIHFPRAYVMAFVEDFFVFVKFFSKVIL
jgi:hypothetical protein